MEALLGVTEAELICGEDAATSLQTMPSASSLDPPSRSKIRSKLKCPGCMNDADVDLDFAKMESDLGKTFFYCLTNVVGYKYPITTNNFTRLLKT